jgi:hypothetical protein
MKRPLHALTGVGAIAHHGFELAAGVGLVFQPYLGLGGAAALWGVGLPGWLVVSARGSDRWNRPLAFLQGLSLSAALVHYTIWPSERRRGLPWLTRAEGLKPGQLPAYNSLLYAWGATALAGLALETPQRARPWAIPGFAVAIALRPSARYHFRWITEQARTNPAWWNRALRRPA